MNQRRKSPVSAGQTFQRVRKVKTGCRTCKLRKVKCDEARPSCHRCISTGRVCDGYGIWGGGNRCSRRSSFQANVSLFREVVPLHFMSASEQACMEWFIHRTARKLPGVFKSAFWTNLLPQASTSAPAVLHAVLTLSSVHKRQALDVDTSSKSGPADTTELFTLQQYTRATSELRQQIGNKGRFSARVALITCAIFIHLEYLRGCYRTAVTHLQHGLVLLEEIVCGDDKTEDGGRDAVDEWIIQTFTTLCLQAKLFGQDVYEPRLIFSRAKPVGETFQSLNDARESLEHILLRIIGLITQRKGCFPSVPANQPSLSELEVNDACVTVQMELDMWLHACETASSSGGKAAAQMVTSDKDRFAWRLLRVYHNLALAMVTGCFSYGVSATNTDNNTPPLSRGPASCSFLSGTSDYPRLLFRSILAQCELLFQLACGPSIYETGVHRFQIDRDASQAIADIGWIPPIYYVAIHGGELHLRRKAISMLRLVPHREGIWNSQMAAAVAEKVLIVEQSKLEPKKEARYRHENAVEGEIVPAVALHLKHEKCNPTGVQVQLPESSGGSLLLKLSICACRDGGFTEACIPYELMPSQWTDTSH